MFLLWRFHTTMSWLSILNHRRQINGSWLAEKRPPDWSAGRGVGREAPPDWSAVEALAPRLARILTRDWNHKMEAGQQNGADKNNYLFIIMLFWESNGVMPPLPSTISNKFKKQQQQQRVQTGSRDANSRYVEAAEARIMTTKMPLLNENWGHTPCPCGMPPLLNEDCGIHSYAYGIRRLGHTTPINFVLGNISNSSSSISRWLGARTLAVLIIFGA